MMALIALPMHPVRAIEYPTPSGFINDYAELLTSEEQQTLEATLNQFKQESGTEIAVMTIPSLEGDPIEDYAVRLFEEWGIGDKEKDNGLLLLIAKDDRAVRIEVGYGLEGTINDAKAGRIIREIIAPRFQQEQYADGITAAVTTLMGEIKQDPAHSLPPEEPAQLPKNIGQFFPLLFIFLMYIGSFLARSKRWWPGGVIGALGGGIAGQVSREGCLGIGIQLGIFTKVLVQPCHDSQPGLRAQKTCRISDMAATTFCLILSRGAGVLCCHRHSDESVNKETEQSANPQSVRKPAQETG